MLRVSQSSSAGEPAGLSQGSNSRIAMMDALTSGARNKQGASLAIKILPRLMA